MSTYTLVAASYAATGFTTLDNTLLFNDKGLVSLITAELNLELVLIALSTYCLLVASYAVDGFPTFVNGLLFSESIFSSDITD